MIPVSEVDIFQDPVAAEVRLPAQEDLEGALDGNFEYEPRFMLATWDDAGESLAVERGRLAAAAKAHTREAFEEILDGDPTDVDDVEEVAPLRGLDVGVAAVVLALNAAGYITSTSCRGHPGRSVYVYPRLDGHDPRAV